MNSSVARQTSTISRVAVAAPSRRPPERPLRLRDGKVHRIVKTKLQRAKEGTRFLY